MWLYSLFKMKDNYLFIGGELKLNLLELYESDRKM